MKKKNQLSEKEELVMELLWMKNEPLTSVEIFQHFETQGWNEMSVYRAVNSLLEKNLLCVCGKELYRSQYARKFEPVLTKEEYIVHVLCRIKKSNIAKIVMALVKEDEKEGNGNDKLVAKLEAIIKEIEEK